MSRLLKQTKRQPKLVFRGETAKFKGDQWVVTGWSQINDVVYIAQDAWLKCVQPWEIGMFWEAVNPIPSSKDLKGESE